MTSRRRAAGSAPRSRSRGRGCPPRSRCALSPISSVVSDFTFTTSFAPCARATSATTAPARRSSRAQCTWAPAAVAAASNCNRYSSSRANTSALIARPASRSASQSSSSATTWARFARIVPVAFARFARSCSLASSRRAATGKRPSGRGSSGREDLRQVDGPARRCCDATARRRSAAGTSHRAAVQNSAPLLREGGGTCPQDRARGVGVLDGERAAEAAALFRVVRARRAPAAHLPQQPKRRVPDAGDTERMTRRVIGDRCGNARPDVLDARAGCTSSSDSSNHPPVDGVANVEQAGIELAHRPDARGRWRDDGVVPRRRSRRSARRAGAPRARSRCSRASARSRSAPPGTPPRARGAPAPRPWPGPPRGTSYRRRR